MEHLQKTAQRHSCQLYNQESFCTSHNLGTNHTAITSGYLYKLARGDSVGKVWHKRYYVLYSDGLMYSYHNARSKTSHRTIPVGRLCLRMKFGKETVNSECRSWPHSVPVEYRFSLINNDRSYHFYTDNETDVGMWKQHLQSTLERLSSPSQVLLDIDEPTPAAKSNTVNLHQDEPTQLQYSSEETIMNVDTEDMSPYDIYTGIGTSSSSSQSSEGSFKYLHESNSPLGMMIESTFGEITALIL